VKDAPATTRHSLHFVRQKDGESVEEFSRRVHFMVMDGFPGAREDTIHQLAIEQFLKGLTDRRAASVALDKNPRRMYKALQYVVDAITNHKVIYGKTAALTRKVSFLNDPHDVSDSDAYDVSLTRFNRQVGNRPLHGGPENKPPAKGPNNNLSQPIRDGTPPSPIDSLTREVKDLTSSIKLLLSKSVLTPPKMESQQRPYAGTRQSPPVKLDKVVCWECKLPGHYRDQCPNRPKSSPATDGAPNKTQNGQLNSPGTNP
jgi:hypothetical protein